MREFQEEQKRLHNAVRVAERDYRKAAKALQLETGKLDMRVAELDTAQRAEDDLHQQHVQATQVTHLSVTNHNPCAVHASAAHLCDMPFCT